MNHVCDKKVWGRLLSFNFFKQSKKKLEDDFEILFYLKVRFYSLVFSRIYPQIFNNKYIFSNIIVDLRDFNSQFNKFFRLRSLFSLVDCHTNSLWISTKKAKIFGYTYAEDIRTPNKLFRVFLSILIRLYISYFLSLLN